MKTFLEFLKLRRESLDNMPQEDEYENAPEWREVLNWKSETSQRFRAAIRSGYRSEDAQKIERVIDSFVKHAEFYISRNGLTQHWTIGHFLEVQKNILKSLIEKGTWQNHALMSYERPYRNFNDEDIRVLYYVLFGEYLPPQQNHANT